MRWTPLDVLRFADELRAAGVGHWIAPVMETVQALDARRTAAAARSKRSRTAQASRKRDVTHDVTSDATNGAAKPPHTPPSDKNPSLPSETARVIKIREEGDSDPDARVTPRTVTSRMAHCGDVEKVFSQYRIAAGGSAFKGKHSDYQQRTDAAEWANGEAERTGGGDGVLVLATSAKNFVDDPKMRAKGWPAGIWLADPGAFMRSRGPAKPAESHEFQHDDPDVVWGKKREAGHG